MIRTCTLPVSSVVTFALVDTEPLNTVCDCNLGLILPVMVAVTGDATTKEPETSLATNPIELTLPVNSTVILLSTTTHEPVSSVLAGLPAKMVIGNKAGG